MAQRDQGLSRFDALNRLVLEACAADRHDDDRDGGRHDAGGVGWAGDPSFPRPQWAWR